MMKWYNPQTEPFRIYGFPFYKEDMVYRRMPLKGEGVLPEAVYRLADETAGGQIRFHAKLKTLSVQVSLASKPGFYSEVKAPHLAWTTRSSFDLYLSRDGKDYVFYGVATKGVGPDEKFYMHKFLELDEEEEFDVLLNFPLYGGVDKVLIGVNEEAEITAPHYQFKDEKKLVIYGTSIQQGACAGRAGMCMSNLLSRWLDREVYNLGFNSSGKCEAEVAEVIAGIEDMAALLIATEGNSPDGEWLNDKLRSFIRIFREKQPDTPVIIMPLLVSGREALRSRLMAERMNFREIQTRIVEDFRAEGDSNIYLFIQDVNKEKVAGHSVWHECTVDGLHYNDLGFYWITETLCSFLKKEFKL